MSKSLGQSFLSFTSILLLLATTQCAAPVDEASTGSSVTMDSLGCKGSSCISPDASIVRIDFAPESKPINAQQAEFDVGGDCNEGSYPSNEIKWELKSGNYVARRSSDLFPGQFRCINGRFQVRVILNKISDTYDGGCNRVGLLACAQSNRVSYDLDIWIESKELASPLLHRGLTKTVRLDPI